MTPDTIVKIDLYISELANCECVDDIWDRFANHFSDMGFDKFTYQTMPFAWETSDDPLLIRTRGFPEDWVETYYADRMWQFDPITTTAMNQSQPFFWSELPQMRDLSDADRRFLDRRNSHVLGDGLAVQVFGPNGFNGYFGLGLEQNATNDHRLDLRAIQWACQMTHHRCSEMQVTESAPLSRREQEVLSWVARGKSNSSIADILAISNNTVDAYMRRIYQKLGVNDRVSAAIRGLGSGLIKSAA
ncbi:LuxR family transcriptional regulator/LuxR family transcriptional regulator, quorum-sensing system regulator CciR [Monaibacterium marinum]|uniref:LuxR family transcriptional regulator/LuxR family transcriptional regulator, quorum-sensing system regulator CciR n=1 Tax=Pontivivens marinum TaxID=1690039 RepID=A0A2C9CTP0_9RHOB|nr:LuxR family transcriptional regulator [Monaibacterium marinum]SOH94570.1 LuxR family transcriptional regulator/LuxR family transcriptional regulator, quorum-sensing system regulator CciR [Monaibacterium marinum]